MATFTITALLSEARRRRVFRVAALYVVGAWITLQAADLAFPGLGIPESAIRYVWMGVSVANCYSSRNRQVIQASAMTLPAVGI